MSEETKTEPESVPVKVLHACEHEVVLAKKDGDRGVQLIHGHPIKEGQPLPPGASLYRVEGNRKKGYRMQTLLEHKGPARVSSHKYREGYDAVFGKAKAPSKELLN